MTPRSHDTLILSLLAVSMAATRINHFAPVPDASWAVFFIVDFIWPRAPGWRFHC